MPPEQAHAPSPHKSEGAFYIWRDEEIGDALGADADVVRLRYGILPDGNAPFDPQNEFTHKNLLYTAARSTTSPRRPGARRMTVADALGRAGGRAPGSARDAGRGRSSTTRCSRPGTA